MNTHYQADIVIEPSPDGDYIIWKGDKVISTGSAAAARLVAAGAASAQLSVYDAEAQHFLAGSLDQLVNQAEAGA
jgi:hypothetical protein